MAAPKNDKSARSEIYLCAWHDSSGKFVAFGCSLESLEARKAADRARYKHDKKQSSNPCTGFKLTKVTVPAE